MASRTPPKSRSTVRHAASPIALPRISKGQRPQFYEHVAVDQLLAIVTALTGEVSVAFDRIDTLERLLVQAGAVTAQDIETFLPGEQATAARAVKRDELIQRVFAVFEACGANRAR